MPRYYPKQEKIVDFDNILEAIKSVKIHHNSVRQSATAHKIPRTNLMRYIAAFDASIDVTTANADVMKNLLAESTTMGTETNFNIEQEKALISYILQASDINYGISLMELRKLAYEFARKVGASYPDPWNDNQRRVLASGDAIVTAANEEVATSEASTSAPASTSGAASSSFSFVSAPQLGDALKSVGPLKLGTPAPKSKRGRKTIESTTLTSPEVVADLRDKAEKRRQKLTKAADEPAAKKQKGRGKSKTPRKRSPSPTETDIEEDFDFCTICKKKMPKHENRQNTAHCIVCDRGVHLKCAGPNPNTYTCIHCESE
ncbi:uncharacterized protein LOC125779402 [Bactrocera dorsalis]|uniref:Uncharacterized protein LOC125779402 n=1 Tax=Bactrocera dorsalis TaxID=27457 RepID=A0ABM3K5G9_BACDO|nr:uncharacterized protein LOC125779402 [Bactrocera dorsalis]